MGQKVLGPAWVMLGWTKNAQKLTDKLNREVQRASAWHDHSKL